MIGGEKPEDGGSAARRVSCDEAVVLCRQAANLLQDAEASDSRDEVSEPLAKAHAVLGAAIERLQDCGALFQAGLCYGADVAVCRAITVVQLPEASLSTDFEAGAVLSMASVLVWTAFDHAQRSAERDDGSPGREAL